MGHFKDNRTFSSNGIAKICNMFPIEKTTKRQIKELKERNIKFMVCSEGKLDIIIIDSTTILVDSNTKLDDCIIIMQFINNSYKSYEVKVERFSKTLEDFIAAFNKCPSDTIKIYGGYKFINCQFENKILKSKGNKYSDIKDYLLSKEEK